MIKKEHGKFVVYSESGKHFGTYDSEKEAKHRLAQMEYFKHIKGSKPLNKKAYLNKVIPKYFSSLDVGIYSGLPDIENAVISTKHLYNKYMMGAKIRNAIASTTKVSRNSAEKAVSKLTKNKKVIRSVKTLAGQSITEPDILLSAAVPIPGAQPAYIVGKKSIKNFIKK